MLFINIDTKKINAYPGIVHKNTHENYFYKYDKIVKFKNYYFCPCGMWEAKKSGVRFRKLQ